MQKRCAALPLHLRGKCLTLRATASTDRVPFANNSSHQYPDMTELKRVVRLGPQCSINPVPASARPPPADNSIASRVGTRQGRSAGKGNFTGIKQTVKANLLKEWWLDNINKSLCAMVVQTEFDSLICAFTAYYTQNPKKKGELKEPNTYTQAVTSPQAF